nr:hypothetical protein [Candidatus Omnitrophota bacterium]
MLKYLILSILFIVFTQLGFAEPVGTVEDSKSSWYAVIGTENKGKKLYMKGDLFSPDKNPAKSLRILDIKKNSLVLEDVILKNSIIVRPGENIPIEGAGMIFEKTVESSVLEYNYNKPPKKFTKNQLEDFTIKSLEKKKIVLEKPYNASSQVKQLSNKEKEIFNSPRDQDADKNVIITELFNKIDSKKIGDNVWVLDRPSAESAIRNAGVALISAIKRVEPRYRLGEGPSLKFNTDLGAAVVNKEGFLVQSIAVAKLTENFGIRKGDIIKSINGYPVNSLLGIYRAYENITSDKGAKFLSLNIARDGKTKTLVYKIK